MSSSPLTFEYQACENSPRIKITRSRYLQFDQPTLLRELQDRQDLKVACKLVEENQEIYLARNASNRRPSSRSLLDEYCTRTGTGATRSLLLKVSQQLRQQRLQERSISRELDTEQRRRRRLCERHHERKTLEKAKYAQTLAARKEANKRKHKKRSSPACKTPKNVGSEVKFKRRNDKLGLIKDTVIERPTPEDLEIHPPAYSYSKSLQHIPAAHGNAFLSGHWNAVRGVVLKKEMKLVQLMASVKRMQDRLRRNKKLSCEDIARDPLSKQAMVTLKLVAKLKNKAVTTKNVFEEVQALLNDGEQNEDQLVTTEEVGLSIAELLDFSLKEDDLEQLNLDLDEIDDFDGLLEDQF